MGEAWDCDYQTRDQEEFLRVVDASLSCDVFIDEAGMEIGHYNKAMIQLATQGRHKGHNVYFISQRASMIAPSVRTNCTRLFAFWQAPNDCDILYKDWGKKELLECCNLPQYGYMYAQRFKNVEVN